MPGVGRRSRTRAKADDIAVPAGRGAKARAPRAQRPTTTRVRKTLSIYLGLVIVLCIVVLAGMAGLGGKLGPFIVVVYAAMGVGFLYYWASSRLAGEELNDDDRVLKTMAGGLSILAVGFAVLSAVLTTLL